MLNMLVGSSCYVRSLSIIKVCTCIIRFAVDNRKCAKKACTYSSNDTQSTGKVYVYPLAATKSPPLLTVTGTDSFMKLGTSVSIGRPHPDKGPLLAISASTLSKTVFVDRHFRT